MALAGERVLLVDLDPQASLSEGLGVYLEDRQESMYAVMTDEREIGEVSRELAVGDEDEGAGGRLALAPAHEHMAGLEPYLFSQLGHEQILKDALGGIEGEYDFVLIDCGPSLGSLVSNAVAAADSLIIPVATQRYSLSGTRRLMRFYSRARKVVNQDLEILGVLLTQVDQRTKGSAEVEEQIRDAMPKLGHRVFETVIRVNTRLAEVPNRAVSIFDYDPRSRGAEDYRGLAKEVLNIVR